MKSSEIRKLVLAAFFLALGIALPQATMRIPEIGSMLLPMHIPVLLCGYFCGVKYGGICGALTPLLCTLIFSRPAPTTAFAMCFELCVYGIVTALLYRRLGVIFSLLSAMVAGRLVYGITSLIIYGVRGEAYTLDLFIAGAFAKAWPGIVIQLILVPLVVTAVEKIIQQKRVA